MELALVPNRSCGTCTACCSLLQIKTKELTKAPDILCSHCTSGGCAIYQSRPRVCRTWHCLWRQMSALPDDLRPDKSRIMFSFETMDKPRTLFEKAFIVGRTLDGPEVFESTPVITALRILREDADLPVWLSHKGNKKLHFPRNEIAAVTSAPYAIHSSSARKEAALWKKNFEEQFPRIALSHRYIGMNFL